MRMLRLTVALIAGLTAGCVFYNTAAREMVTKANDAILAAEQAETNAPPAL